MCMAGNTTGAGGRGRRMAYELIVDPRKKIGGWERGWRFVGFGGGLALLDYRSIVGMLETLTECNQFFGGGLMV